jgi:hypothetical protein
MGNIPRVDMYFKLLLLLNLVIVFAFINASEAENASGPILTSNFLLASEIYIDLLQATKRIKNNGTSDFEPVSMHKLFKISQV